MSVFNFLRCIHRRLFTITICLSLLIIITRVYINIYGKSVFIPETNYNISWIDSAKTFEDSLNKSYCNNTLQGATKITDDRGFLCPRRNLLINGCCDRTKRSTLRHVCSTCSLIFCCQSYEICVSCCLSPINSVVNANAYRDPSRKYCFGVDPPELKIPFDKEEDIES